MDTVHDVVVLEAVAILVGETDDERKGGDTLGLENGKAGHAVTLELDPVDPDIALLDFSSSMVGVDDGRGVDGHRRGKSRRFERQRHRPRRDHAAGERGLPPDGGLVAGDDLLNGQLPPGAHLNVLGETFVRRCGKPHEDERAGEVDALEDRLRREDSEVVSGLASQQRDVFLRLRMELQLCNRGTARGSRASQRNEPSWQERCCASGIAEKSARRHRLRRGRDGNLHARLPGYLESARQVPRRDELQQHVRIGSDPSIQKRLPEGRRGQDSENCRAS